MPAPDELLHLIDTFDRNLDAYRASSYNEAQLRQEFLNPFFTALGWDVNNTRGYAEAYKDVIHEDAIKIGAATKAPQQQKVIARQITATDQQIDRLVYQLYDLTEEEISIVEEQTTN